MKLKNVKRVSAILGYGPSKACASVGCSQKTVGIARKRVLLKRTIDKSTGGKVQAGHSASTKALQRAVRMMKK